MRILQVSATDLTGSRFTNFDFHLYCRSQQIDSRYMTWRKRSNDANTFALSSSRWMRRLRRQATRAERFFGLQSVLQVGALPLMISPSFRRADVVHYHLIHQDFSSLLALPLLSRLKPSIWTWHDPWTMTGHCVYPLECSGWRTGCHNCPHLARPLAMCRDGAHTMWRIKRVVYRLSDVDIVVASRHMMDMVRASPLCAANRVHMIPYGIDLELFRPTDSAAARARLGIPPSAQVICFRATSSPYKGLSLIRTALAKLGSRGGSVWLLTLGERGLVRDLGAAFPIIELGWTEDPQTLSFAYNAADFFVMPSSGEAFGLMAVEAMACGKPVLTVDGTSLPDVVGTPDCGISVPRGDVDGLARAMGFLLDNHETRAKLGMNGRRRTEAEYDVRLMRRRLLGLYAEVVARRRQEEMDRWSRLLVDGDGEKFGASGRPSP